VFLKPLVREFHGSRAGISLAFTLANLANAITFLWLGNGQIASDQEESYSWQLVFLESSSSPPLLASPVLWKLYVFYVVLGIAGSGPAPVPYSKVGSSWFDKRRGLALGLTMFGLGSGAIVIPFVAQRLIVTLGWRGAYATIAPGYVALQYCFLGWASFGMFRVLFRQFLSLGSILPAQLGQYFVLLRKVSNTSSHFWQIRVGAGCWLAAHQVQTVLDADLQMRDCVSEIPSSLLCFSFSFFSVIVLRLVLFHECVHPVIA
jgi:hypothetical protein